jgi:hypothetical protein
MRGAHRCTVGQIHQRGDDSLCFLFLLLRFWGGGGADLQADERQQLLRPALPLLHTKATSARVLGVLSRTPMHARCRLRQVCVACGMPGVRCMRHARCALRCIARGHTLLQGRLLELIWICMFTMYNRWGNLLCQLSKDGHGKLNVFERGHRRDQIERLRGHARSKRLRMPTGNTKAEAKEQG